MSINCDELKKLIIELVEEDKVFRYALAGALGITEILRKIEDLSREINNLRSKVEALNISVGALTEASSIRYFIDDLKSSGELIFRIDRNLVIDFEGRSYEINAYIETDKRYYVVEVKTKPNHHNVDDLLKEVEILERIGILPGKEAITLGREVRSVLIGVYVGDDIVKYANSRKVLVRKY